MTDEIAKAINDCNKRINEVSQRLDGFFNMLHEKNADNIEENSNGIFDLADLADENSTSIFDLADMLAELDERVTALEEK